MLPLIRHVVLTSARRDRTEINDALIDAMEEIFHPLALAIHRCYDNGTAMIIFTCAGFDTNGRFSRNAYLPDRQYCRPIEAEPLLDRCRRQMMVTRDDFADGSHRLIFPVRQADQLLYLIDVTLPQNFPVSETVVLMGLTEYFSNHIGLLDYGETDTLTRLANRKTFDKHLFEVLGTAARDDPGNPSVPGRRHGDGDDAQHWLAVCDIDHFKSINDNHGHLIGDEVLVMLAQLMRGAFRFDDQLFRFGGEEFVVVLQPTSQANAIKVFERFRRAVENHAFSRVGHVTISIGITRLLAFDLPTDAIGRADEALYFSKQHGRNQVAQFEALVEQGDLVAKSVSTNEMELF